MRSLDTSVDGNLLEQIYLRIKITIFWDRKLCSLLRINVSDKHVQDGSKRFFRNVGRATTYQTKDVTSEIEILILNGLRTSDCAHNGDNQDSVVICVRFLKWGGHAIKRGTYYPNNMLIMLLLKMTSMLCCVHDIHKRTMKMNNVHAISVSATYKGPIKNSKQGYVKSYNTRINSGSYQLENSYLKLISVRSF